MVAHVDHRWLYLLFDEACLISWMGLLLEDGTSVLVTTVKYAVVAVCGAVSVV